jgi:hypothetical protein
MNRTALSQLSRWIALTAAGLALAALRVHAVTTIDISTNAAVTAVKRFGINLGYNNYYDSGQMLKELVFNNPGFEGLLFQSAIHIGGGTSTSAIESTPFTQWPSGFWDGAGYEFIWGGAKGRTGVVTRSIAPNRPNPPTDPSGSTNGTTYLFTNSGTVPRSGDHAVLRKYFLGGAQTGWNTATNRGGRVETEFNDLPPGTQGRQCIRLTALTPGDFVSLSSANDTFGTFILLNGAFRLSFKAKGVGGANRIQVSVRRSPPGTNFTYLSQLVQLTNTWQKLELDFSAAETPAIRGPFSVIFTPVSQSAVLLDDVSLRETGGDPSNPTPFRDAVVTALQQLKPGILRGSTFNFGDSLENITAPPLARLRSAYTSYGTNQNLLVYDWHEFLQLSEHIGAEPWHVVPVTFSEAEIAGLMEYLAGPANTFWGARRAARGRVKPWTDAFAKIHLEFGNEAWNPVFRGAAIEVAPVYGMRASEIFGVAKSSPYYTGGKFDFILGGQATYPGRNRDILNASTNHDSFAVAPYMAYLMNDFANNEELFGTLFAESEMVSRLPDSMYGYMRENLRLVRASPHPTPLSIYEVNLHTTTGAISQQALDSFTPSLGAGLAVADHMLMMLRELGCRDQCLFSLPGWRFARADGKTVLLWSVLRDMGVTDRKRPQYLAASLSNEALNGDLLQTTHTGDDPTWNQPLLNRVQYPAAHYLRSYAFASGSRRALIVFNLHRSGPLEVNFSGPNAPRGLLTLKRLTSANITDNNENAANVSISTQTLSNFDPSQNLSLPPYSMNAFRWSEPASLAALSLPRLCPPQRLSDGTIRLSFGDHGGQPLTAGDASHFEVWTTDDLNTGHWTLLPASLSVTNGLLYLDLPDAMRCASRFYRVAAK